MPYPTRERMREFAAEEAQAKVSALLQAFALPSVDEETIHRLLIDAITNTFVHGYACGWDASLDAAIDTLKAGRFHRREDT